MRKIGIGLAAVLAASFIILTGCSTGSGSKAGDDLTGQEGVSEGDLNAQREDRFGAGSVPVAEGEGMFRDVRFALESSAISDSARQAVEYNAQVLKSNPTISVQLEGHCDERGTAEYNMALGAARARSVYNMLISLGVSAQRLDTISYGEEVPLELGHDENAWAKNRRVHLSAFTGSRAPRQR